MNNAKYRRLLQLHAAQEFLLKFSRFGLCVAAALVLFIIVRNLL